MKDSITNNQLLNLSKNAYKRLLDLLKLLKEYEDATRKANYLKKLYDLTSNAVEMPSKLVLSNMKLIREASPESSVIPGRLEIKEEAEEERTQRILERVNFHLQSERARQKAKTKKKKSKPKQQTKYLTMTREQAEQLEESKSRGAEEEPGAQEGAKERKVPKKIRNGYEATASPFNRKRLSN